MYSRLLAKPDTSILLFGPRGTGKSTWIRQYHPLITRPGYPLDIFIGIDIMKNRKRTHPEPVSATPFIETAVRVPLEVVMDRSKTISAVEMAAAKLIKESRLKYVGPQKGGHWEVVK